MKTPNIDMESAVCDAADMARIAVSFAGTVLRLEQRHKRGLKLDQSETALLMFVLYQTEMKARHTKALFYGEEQPPS